MSIFLFITSFAILQSIEGCSLLLSLSTWFLFFFFIFFHILFFVIVDGSCCATDCFFTVHYVLDFTWSGKSSYIHETNRRRISIDTKTVTTICSFFYFFFLFFSHGILLLQYCKEYFCFIFLYIFFILFTLAFSFSCISFLCVTVIDDLTVL